MKLYQAVKQYGLDRVRMAVAGGKLPPRLKAPTIAKIKKVYEEASTSEKRIFDFSAVSIAFWFLYEERTLWKLYDECTYNECQKIDALKNLMNCISLAQYMLEFIEPENQYVKAQKLFRKNYYRKKI